MDVIVVGRDEKAVRGVNPVSIWPGGFAVNDLLPHVTHIVTLYILFVKEEHYG